MTTEHDIARQLRTYVDAVADPVTIAEVRARVDTRRPRRRVGLVLVAAFVVLALVATVVAVRATDTNDSPQPVRPAASHGRVLRVVSQESCAGRVIGDPLRMGVRLSNGAIVCSAAQNGATINTVSGIEGGKGVGFGIAPTPMNTFTVEGPAGHLTLFNVVAPEVAAVHYTFCDGTTADAVPFSDRDPSYRMVAFEVDKRYGSPGFEPLDSRAGPLAAPTRGTKPKGASGGRTCKVPSYRERFPAWNNTTPLRLGQPTGPLNSLAATEQTVATSVRGPDGSFLASGPDLTQLSQFTPPYEPDAGFSQIVRWSGGFLAIGSESSDALQMTRAMIATATNGQTWDKADTGPFTPSGRATAGIGSIVRSVAEHGGLLVAVGDFSTHNRDQQSGLSPAVWTSRDGVRWQRRIVDLGDGYDPYMTSIVWFDGKWVASGRIGRYPATVWTSTDLQHWERHVIQPRANAELFVANGVLYAAGNGGIRPPGTSTSASTTPQYGGAVWRSSDAVHWQPVLVLRSSPSISTFVAVLPAGRALVAVGTTGAQRDGTVVYQSADDGKSWSAVPAGVPLFGTGHALTGFGMLRGAPAIASTSGATSSVATAVAPPSTGHWAAQCKTLNSIKQLGEQPQLSLSLAKLRNLYDRLVARAPSDDVKALWRTARPVLGQGVTKAQVTAAQRDAVHQLDDIVARDCGESTLDVFKIGVG